MSHNYLSNLTRNISIARDIKRDFSRGFEFGGKTAKRKVLREKDFMGAWVAPTPEYIVGNGITNTVQIKCALCPNMIERVPNYGSKSGVCYDCKAARKRARALLQKRG